MAGLSQTAPRMTSFPSSCPFPEQLFTTFSIQPEHNSDFCQLLLLIYVQSNTEGKFLRHISRTLLLTSCFLIFAIPCLANEQLDQAIDAALAFSTLIDNGNIQAAYWSGSELLRVANDEQEWIDRTTRTQHLLGKVEQRTLGVVRTVASFPGLPDDEYVIVSFKARSTHKANAAEFLLVHQDNGIFKVCSYSIR